MMAKKGPKKDPRFNISPSYVCVDCGLANRVEDRPEKCENCGCNQFHKLLIKANWDTRQPFNLDERQVSPI